MNFRNIDQINNSFRIFRDDLYPFLGGGNKGRKIVSIIDYMKRNGYNAIVSTGGIQSNHNRATAIAAALNRWPCSLVIHGEKERSEREYGNAMIVKESGAKLVFVDSPSEIGAAMDKEMSIYKEAGLNPYYLTGGGHVMPGGLAYINAIGELNNYCQEQNWCPDYIFHASGTGSTQAGILAGLDKYGLNSTKVIGISVARERERAQSVVASFYRELCDHYKIKSCQKEVIVLDDYLCGGYEKYNSELKELSISAIKDYGFILDTTYSGKAFYGMLKTIERNNLKDKNILFWHTGGIFNFLA
ncbi:pyridoxal-phosphate dependent enzyme [Bacteroidales bacterium OttesenSCG-928-A17]|nr:pyridoxal-phosphate dependent enzyme [Bacteroidales bacterium OttesenSCG-928-A17]